jgi:surface antigen
MKNTAIPKALRQQAQLRKIKTPDVLAQQSALNSVMLGRKGGAHHSPANRREQVAKVRAKEAHKELHN